MCGNLVRVGDLELSFGCSADDARMLSTLVRNGGAQARGGLGTIFQAEAMDGRVIAVKRMIPPKRGAFSSDESWRAELSWRTSAFREEYAVLCQLAAFKGFVKVYGFGVVDGMPAILMEWVVGVSLSKLIDLPAFKELAGDERTLTVARIGRDLFHLLARLEAQAESFVHRDISPANVMVRLGERSLAQQVEEGQFDLCLIDFGSAFALRDGDGTFTSTMRVIRGATPEFAPPEMLTNDLPGLAELRSSTKIDVYAACSVLYWLLCGRTPFGMAYRSGEDSVSDYLYKMAHDPISCGFAPSSVESLLEDVALLGIRPTQDARASSYALYKSLDYYVLHFSDNVQRTREGSFPIGLDVRAIDAPLVGDEQIDLSNPLANAAMRPRATTDARNRAAIGERMGDKAALASDVSSRPSASCVKPQSQSSRMKGGRRLKPPILAVVAIACVAVLAFVVAGITAVGDLVSSGASVQEGREQAHGEPTWMGALNATSQRYACYGAEAYPFEVSLRSIADTGRVSFDVRVLFHGHDRSQLAGDISSFASDSYLSLEGLEGSIEGSTVKLDYSDTRALGSGAALVIELSWNGELANAEELTAAVTSYYGNSFTTDWYTVTR